MRRAAVDANQAEIVKALRKVGATVQPLHRVGQGCPDLAVGHGGVNHMIEVKDGSKPPSARGLTDAPHFATFTRADEIFEASEVPLG